MALDAQAEGDSASKESLSSQIEVEATLELSSSKPNPVVIYIPAHSASSVLRSKSSVEMLCNEATDPASTTLLILGDQLAPDELVKRPDSGDASKEEVRMDKTEERSGGEMKAPPEFSTSATPFSTRFARHIILIR